MISSLTSKTMHSKIVLTVIHGNTVGSPYPEGPYPQPTIDPKSFRKKIPESSKKVETCYAPATIYHNLEKT